MKLSFLGALLLLTLTVFGQRKASLFILANGHFATKGFGTNEVGWGMHLAANKALVGSLHLRAEAGVDGFFGSKLARIDAAGNVVGSNAGMTSAKIGAEWFATSKLSILLLGGAARIRYWGEVFNGGCWKAGLNAYAGPKRRTQFGIYYNSVRPASVRFVSLQVGLKVF